MIKLCTFYTTYVESDGGYGTGFPPAVSTKWNSVGGRTSQIHLLSHTVITLVTTQEIKSPTPKFLYVVILLRIIIRLIRDTSETMLLFI